MNPIPRLFTTSILLSLVTATASSAIASGGGSSANEGDVLRSGDSVQLATQSFATGCIGFRGLADSTLQGYATVMDPDSHHESLILEARDREQWREGESKRLDFSHRSEVHVISGQVEITEINYSGGGCPNRLGIR
ncbi:hypothetical protein [Thioalkalivibrio sp. ALM2T]|uniref:hypothetical protein n=1 Tax=Thioalkalivibrio sp. ALM2T TaxID=1158184 RepID=UPI000476B149|nr:hypothetical protein [Thioalkalivibrio sp. ALM2T]